jgi:hypothetical protein
MNEWNDNVSAIDMETVKERFLCIRLIRLESHRASLLLVWIWKNRTVDHSVCALPVLTNEGMVIVLGPLGQTGGNSRVEAGSCEFGNKRHGSKRGCCCEG